MSTFISTAPGKVVRVNTGRPSIPFSISLPGFPTGQAIVTNAQIQQAGNFQFLHTLQDFIFVYIFGDRIGQLSIQGIAFLDSCASGGAGLESMIRFYNRNRIAFRPQPVRVGFGNIPFEGFLTAGQFQAEDNGSVGSLGRFALSIQTFPGDDDLNQIPGFTLTRPGG